VRTHVDNPDSEGHSFGALRVAWKNTSGRVETIGNRVPSSIPADELNSQISLVDASASENHPDFPHSGATELTVQIIAPRAVVALTITAALNADPQSNQGCSVYIQGMVTNL
jgi:hypothetical protein